MTDTHTLTLSRQIAAPPAILWRCLTEPDLLAQWFAPKPVEVFDVAIDPVPGGIFSFAMRMPGGDPFDTGPAGCILVAEPEHRFVWTAALGPGFRPNPPHSKPDDFYMTAEMTLAARDGGTYYTATALHATAEATAAHEAMGFHGGWGMAAAQLEELAKAL